MTSLLLNERRGRLVRLRARLATLYRGRTRAALRFQAAVLVIDVLIIGFFLATPVLESHPAFLIIDYSIALLVGCDLTARAIASSDLRRWFRRLDVWVDVFILVTLLAPSMFANLGFLRVLRIWTVSRSPIFWHYVSRHGYGHWQGTAGAVASLLAFLFVTTGFVYTFFAHKAAGIETYVDALYFTVATVTTTGFGDITLPGPWGRLTSVAAMIIGISLFVRLAQSIFRPYKVTFTCPQCALMRHEPDAVHCKACGHQLKIPNEES